MAAPERSPRAEHFYALTFADVHLCAQIIENALRHDQRLVEYLRAGPNTDDVDFQNIAPLLDALLERISHKGLSASRDMVQRCLSGDDVDFWSGFVENRARIGHDVMTVLLCASSIHEQIRTLASRLAPELLPQLGRIEISDGFAVQTFQRLGDTFAERLSSWIRPHLAVPEGELQTPTAFNFSENHVVQVRYDEYYLVAGKKRHFRTTQELQEAAASNGGPLPLCALHQHVQVPYWKLSLIRYAVLLAHEFAHAWADLLLRHNIDVVQRFTVAQAAIVEIASQVSPDLVPPVADRHAVQQWRKQWEPRAALLLTESLCDLMAMAIAGPCFLPAIATYFSGAANRDYHRDVRAIAPVGLRLQVLRHFRPRVLSGKEGEPTFERFTQLIGACQDKYAAACESGSAGDGPYGGNRMTYLLWQQKAAGVLINYLESVVDVIGSPQAMWSDDPDLQSMNVLWKKVEDILGRGPGKDFIAALRDMPEGRTVTDASYRRRSSTKGFVFGPDAWELDMLSLRSRGRNFRSQSDVPEAFVKRVRDGFAGAKSGWTALTLGAADGFVLRPGFKMRATDGITTADFPELAAYTQRKILLELRGLSGDRGDLLSRSLARADGLFPFAVSQIRHRGGDDGICALIQELLSRRIFQREGAEVAPIKVFVGTGWSQTLWLWGVRSLSALRELHQDVLTAQGLPIERSVTHIIPWVWPPNAEACMSASVLTIREADEAASAVDVHVRVREARNIPRAAEYLSGALRTGPTGAMAADSRPVFGLYDIVARAPVCSGAEIETIGRELWMALASGVIARSVTELALPVSRVIGSAETERRAP